MQKLPQYAKSVQLVYAPAWKPPRLLEYAYYLLVSYSLLGSLFVRPIPLLAGGTMAALAAFCIVRLGSCTKKVLAPVAPLLACAISFILMQIAIHGESITDSTIRSFITW